MHYAACCNVGCSTQGWHAGSSQPLNAGTDCPSVEALQPTDAEFTTRFGTSFRVQAQIEGDGEQWESHRLPEPPCHESNQAACLKVSLSATVL